MNQSRRKILKAATDAAVSVAAPTVWRSARASTELFVADSGGAITDVYRELLYKPFEAETGIRVTPVARRARPGAEFKSQVATGKYIWDCVQGAGSDEALQWNDAGLIEPLELSGPQIEQISVAMRTNPGFVAEQYPNLQWSTGNQPPRDDSSRLRICEITQFRA